MKRKVKDRLLNGVTYGFSSIGLFVLLAIVIFVFVNGVGSLSWHLVTGDYYTETYDVQLTPGATLGTYEDPHLEDTYFSLRWGLSFQDGEDTAGDPLVSIAYIDTHSPLATMAITGGGYLTLTKGQNISKALLKDADDNLLIALPKNGASQMASYFDEGVTITDMLIATTGGGIRGSIVTTLLLILLTLLIALPIGIGAAIYLHEYAPQNKITHALREMIKITTGIPSVIFGLVGAVLFIPMMNLLIGSSGGSVASGALTLAIIVLPVIVETTEEALKVVPLSYRQASLALGASATQTTFRVVLPSAVPGILTATLLAIGRIIGESAALIYAIGAVIKDQVAINDRSTSLAVHIWSVLGGEVPNIYLAAAIAVIILSIVFILSVLVKALGRRLTKEV